MTVRSPFCRPATTLVEILVFLAVFAVVTGLVLPLLYSATENRLLQQTASLVEHNGMEALQALSYRAQAGERILAPPPGTVGAIVTLQTGSGVSNPTIIGVLSGSLVVIRRATKQILTSPQVAVENFRVRNTSASPSQQSFTVSFNVSRTLRLQSSHVYERPFEALFSLSPDDAQKGDCDCPAPSCTGNRFIWSICENGQCSSASTQLDCQD